jgi:hypothetical protein
MEPSPRGPPWCGQRCAQASATSGQGDRTPLDDRCRDAALVGDIGVLEMVPGGGGHDLRPGGAPMSHCGPRFVAEGSGMAVS